MVPCIDFSQNYSQEVNDITFWNLLQFGYLAKKVDVETAFFNGDLKEEFYMDYPQGMSEVEKMTASL